MASGTAAYIKAAQVGRINKELNELMRDEHPHILGHQKISEKEHIYALKFHTDMAPYSSLMFTLRVELDGEYPYKPPVVKFANKLYHPNIDPVSFEVCLPILSYDNWKPATTLEAIIFAVVQIFYEPDLSRPVDIESAEDYIKNRSLFMKKAEELALKAGEKPVKSN